MINLRKELEKILKKRYDTIILRHMTDTRCYCWRERSNTPDPECPNCEGSGYIFNEHLVKCKLFNTPSFAIAHAQDFDYGVSYSNTYVIYFDVTDVSETIKINDLVFEIKIHQNGVPFDPIARTRKWIVIDSYKLNLDDGKREFIKVYAKPTVV